jgi:hypothetical protein
VAVAGFIVFGLVGCDALTPALPTPTPAPPTPTRLQREESELLSAWHQVNDKHGTLLRQGVRVAAPVSADHDDDNTITLPTCSPAFPVIGTDYGVYYLPSDELYRGLWTGIYRSLCFASEEDAVRAGYQRGPH